jgi:hypothetical protein
MLHGDTIVFVEDDEWFIQINRKCKALLPDNRCGIYENRPEICREYTTEECDWHGEEYDYEHLFTEPEQIQVFAKEYLANKRKRKTKAKQSSSKSSSKSKSSEGSSSSSKRRSGSKKKRAGRARPGLPLKLLKTA